MKESPTMSDRYIDQHRDEWTARGLAVRAALKELGVDEVQSNLHEPWHLHSYVCVSSQDILALAERLRGEG
jgi:hypothetical protein